MKANWMLAAGVLGLTLLAACGGSSDDGNGGGTNSGACTISANGEVEACVEWSDLPTSASNSYCSSSSAGGTEVITAVSTCPSANAVGTCTFIETVESTTYTFEETFYGDVATDCSEVKEACLAESASVSGASITASFSGGC